jgi:hypothetical protein
MSFDSIEVNSRFALVERNEAAANSSPLLKQRAFFANFW